MREVLTEPESAASSSRLYCPAPVRSRCSPHGTRIRSFGFEFQGPCSAFTSWRARKRDPKTFSLPAHNQELVLGHVTFVLQQLFQISLERGFCFNHRIERLLHRGRQIICIDVLPLQFFPCHCLTPPRKLSCAHKSNHCRAICGRALRQCLIGGRASFFILSVPLLLSKGPCHARKSVGRRRSSLSIIAVADGPAPANPS